MTQIRFGQITSNKLRNFDIAVDSTGKNTYLGNFKALSVFNKERQVTRFESTDNDKTATVIFKPNPQKKDLYERTQIKYGPNPPVPGTDDVEAIEEELEDDARDSIN